MDGFEEGAIDGVVVGYIVGLYVNVGVVVGEEEEIFNKSKKLPFNNEPDSK